MKNLVNHGEHPLLPLIINGQAFEWKEQYVTGKELKEMAGIPFPTELFLSIKRPWEDELIENDKRVDLARPEIEHFYCKKKLEFFINETKHEWFKQYITGFDLRKIAVATEADKILLAIERPWEDEVIEDETQVDLARPGIERFIIKKHDEDLNVTIEINEVRYPVKRGKYTVSEIKKIGGLPQTYVLEELINGKLTPLADDATVLIKGCEIFFGHVRDGSSS